MIELLAPAGSFEKMKFAFEYGSDACYLGIPDFSLRARLNDFTLDSVKESVKYAHSLNKKIYVTFNIFAHNYHIDNFLEKREVKSSGMLPDDCKYLKLFRSTSCAMQLRSQSIKRLINMSFFVILYNLDC